ncbi:MAG: RNA polymerase sigma factor [Crocinitomicaceae bacterium]|nr:RNA polymerase sigma factor [Crocinitomicaceae bacterium]
MTALEFNTAVCALQGDLKTWAYRFTKNDFTAEDLSQEAIYRALTNRSKYKPGTNLKSWVYTIMKNAFLNQYNKNKRFVENGDEIAYSDRVSSGNRVFEMDELEEKEIQQKIDALNVSIRKPFLMNYEGFSYQEISDEMGIPMGTVKSRIFNARKTLSDDLLRNGYESSN